MSDAILFDGHEVDHLEGLSERPRRLGGDAAAVGRPPPRLEGRHVDVAEAFDLHETTARYLSTPHEQPVLLRSRPLHPHHHVRAARGRGRRAARRRVRRRRELGGHRPRRADPGAGGVRRQGLGLRRHRHARRTQLPRRLARVGPRVLLRRVRAHGAAARGVRRPSHARRRLRQGHRRAHLDAPTGGQAATCAGRPPLRPRGADPSRARAARQRQVVRAIRVALPAATKPPCRKRGMPERSSSAPSMSSSLAAATTPTRS